MKVTTVFLLILTIFSLSSVNICKKSFKKPAPVFFSFISGAVTFFFFLVLFFIQNGIKFNVVHGLFSYAIPYSICFILFSILCLLALKNGDFSLTGLFLSFGLILPTLYGIIFLKDEPTIFFWVGLVFFFVCLILTNVKFVEKKEKPKKKITLKWVLLVVFSSVANGGTSIFQTMQQKAYGGKFGNEFMVVSLFIVCLTFLIVSLSTEKKYIRMSAKDCLIKGSITGLITGILNVLVIIFTGQNLLPVSIFFPVLFAGNLIVTFVFGYTIFKEKYDWLQYIGIVCGVISVILLNI